MEISKTKWKRFGSKLRSSGSFEEARKHAKISLDDYYVAHKGKDPLLAEEMAKARLLVAEKAIESLQYLAITKKRGMAATKILEAYMPGLFRQKMAHKITLDARHTLVPQFANANLFLDSGDHDVVDATVLREVEGDGKEEAALPEGASKYDLVRARAELAGVGERSGVPEAWESPQAEESGTTAVSGEDESATVESEVA